MNIPTLDVDVMAGGDSLQREPNIVSMASIGRVGGRQTNIYMQTYMVSNIAQLVLVSNRKTYRMSVIAARAYIRAVPHKGLYCALACNSAVSMIRSHSRYLEESVFALVD